MFQALWRWQVGKDYLSLPLEALPSLPLSAVFPGLQWSLTLLSAAQISAFFYLYQQLGAKFYQILPAHLIPKTPTSVFYGQSPACSKGWEQVDAAPVTFGPGSFSLFLMHSCPMTSWSPCDPSQTFRPALAVSPIGLLCLLLSSPAGWEDGLFLSCVSVGK